MTNEASALRGRPAALRGGSVRIEGARKVYGSVRALDDVSLEVAPGEFLALLGPSGSGKTTLLMTVAGFEVPDAGMITVDGRDVTTVPPNRRDLGMVFQRYALFPHMSLRDNVGFPLRMRGVATDERAARADRVLGVVGLEGYGDRLPSQLSGGQQQRVALARAIVYEPPVLLMDEPLSALDKNLREQMRLEIKHLQKRLGVTVIFVTHDQEEALVMADRIAVLDKGRLVQIGAPRELYEKPCNPFVAGFLGETNFLTGTVAGRDAAGAPALALQNGASVAGSPAVPLDEGARALLSIRPEQITLQAGPAAAGALGGRVAEVIYAGASTIYLVDVGTGAPLNVRRPSGAEETLGEGTPVRVTWRASDARIFPAEA